MKKIALFTLLLACTPLLRAQMVLQYHMEEANEIITLPLYGTVDVTVNWGDSSAIQAFTTQGDKYHTYADTGTFTVTIQGTLTHYGSLEEVDNHHLVRVLSWDNLGLTSLSGAFRYADALLSVPTSLPTSVTDLTIMFFSATSFNQALDTWNTVNVTTMNGMFGSATSFNQPIGSWNTENVTDMSGMFGFDSAFNQPIGAWNTAKVTTMEAMFFAATSFNQPIGSWNTANVTDMSFMFKGANSFNQVLGMWNISSINDMDKMFIGDTLCTMYYDNLLNGWAAQKPIANVLFDGGGSKYSSVGSAAKASLISQGWTITDGGPSLDNHFCTITGWEELVVGSAFPALHLYPNPTAESFTISSEETMGPIQVYNSLGDLVWKATSGASSQKVDLGSNEKGMYMVKVGNSMAKLLKE